MAFASLNFLLSHLTSLDSISCLASVVALMSLGYSIIVWGASLKRGFRTMWTTVLEGKPQLPCIIWLVVTSLRNPACLGGLIGCPNLTQNLIVSFGSSFCTRLSPDWCSQFCIITGIALTMVAPIGAPRTIILTAKSYKFYS